ncbi:unnamed protein product [Bursaphelenchus xylophilus]|uniref:(pine wood nematode) hypothetical protein n=1 Tax=Bursaphelenchus xylophilus TaxID=6326 RepID=A0A1I7S8C0_BURXY|nr:unnamed protein product [Bursaphelenchus xylophilus]CAG9120935.1 unnamed protein product [Bursaphelenchus xylophilus]
MVEEEENAPKLPQKPSKISFSAENLVEEHANSISTRPDAAKSWRSEGENVGGVGKSGLYKSQSNPLRSSTENRRQPLRRAYSIREKISHETAKFFGLPMHEDAPEASVNSGLNEQISSQENKWKKRRFRHLKSAYGVKTDEVVQKLQNIDTTDSAGNHLDNLSVYTAVEPEKRDSVAKMAYNAVQSILNGDMFRKKRLPTLAEERGSSVSALASPTPAYQPIRERNKLRNKRSFPLMSHYQINLPSASAQQESTVGQSFRSHDAPSTSTSPHQVEDVEARKDMYEQFEPAGFTGSTPEAPSGTTGLYGPRMKTPKLEKTEDSEVPTTSTPMEQPKVRQHRVVCRTDRPQEWQQPLFSTSVTVEHEHPADTMEMHEWPRKRMRDPSQTPIIEFSDQFLDDYRLTPPERTRQFPVEPADRHQDTTKPLIGPHVARTPATSTPGQRHHRGVGDLVHAKERRVHCIRQVLEATRNPQGISRERPSKWSRDYWFGRRGQRERSLPIFGQYKRTKADPLKGLADSRDDYRPIFTYWCTAVQIAVSFIVLLIFGIGTDFTHGIGVIERSGDVLASSMSFQHIVIFEQNNIFIGPRFSDLVHIGAKYTPCMRQDPRIQRLIADERALENNSTGCCVGPDGCFQTSSCPKQFATFHKFVHDGSHRAVCGQDPRYCLSPRSVKPVEWSVNITDWPVCQEKVPDHDIPQREAHMKCEVMGRPCCIQMHGQCRITTREYCDFVRGYYHENATLCSQVSCLNDVCGMTPFMQKEVPDQFYRFFSALFIHAGILPILVTCGIQLTIMRKFEHMIGWIRMAIIYFVSGIGGYLASASFAPYMPSVGPASAQAGVLGALVLNVIYNWNVLTNPKRALLQHLALAAFLFLTGFFPYIDNWAQVTGFIYGMIMFVAVVPYVTFGRGTRLVIVIFSLITAGVLTFFLMVLFYGLPVIDSPWLDKFNCPFSGHICEQQGLTLRSWLPI